MASDPSWLPTPERVAAVIGRFLPDGTAGTWSDEVSPTYLQVRDIISAAAQDVAGRAQVTITPELEGVAGSAAVYLAAAEVILSFFPEADLDYVKMLRSWADSGLTRLGVASSDTGSGGGSVPAIDIPPATPTGQYPQPVCDPLVW